MTDGNGKSSPSEDVVTSQRTTPLAIRILQRIQAKEILPSSLSEDQRRICVRYLISIDKYENTQIADILDVSEATIYRDKRRIKQDVTFESIMIDEASVAADIIECAEKNYIRLTLEKKFKDAWIVKKECVELLQSMGFIRKVQPDINIKGQISLKEVFEGAAADQFRSDELDSGFSADGLDRFMETS